MGTPSVDSAIHSGPNGSRGLWWTWSKSVTLGEFTGFIAPAVAGAATVGAHSAVVMPVLLGAGAIEGWLLGWAQARVLRRVLPALPVARWITVTIAAAVVAWSAGLACAAVFSMTALPPVVPVLLAAVAGFVLLGSIGLAQWTVLRDHVRSAGHWIWIAVGWLAGLALFTAVTTPLWQPGQPLPLVAGIGVVGGLAMAVTMAGTTGALLLRLLARQRVTAGGTPPAGSAATASPTPGPASARFSARRRWPHRTGSS